MAAEAVGAILPFPHTGDDSGVSNVEANRPYQGAKLGRLIQRKVFWR
jgi:hypothetical protein